MITAHRQKAFDDEFAKLRREDVNAVLIDQQGNCTEAVVEVLCIPDGEHEGELVHIDHHRQGFIAAVEIEGRRYEWRPTFIGEGYWAEAEGTEA